MANSKGVLRVLTNSQILAYEIVQKFALGECKMS